MSIATKAKLVISGVGSAPGGTYQTVKINGQGMIDGELECAQVTIRGQATCSGTIKAGRLSVMGNVFSRDHAIADTIGIMGEANFGGGLRAGRLSCTGSVVVRGDAKVDTVRLRGSLEVRGSCEAEQFVADGAFQIDGMLNAGVVDLTLIGPSHVREIGGEKIMVRRRSLIHFANRLLGKSMHSGLSADVIEGDDVHLVHTSAAVVRGNRVTIGPGCSIGLVEYKQSCRISRGLSDIQARKL